MSGIPLGSLLSFVVDGILMESFKTVLLHFSAFKPKAWFRYDDASHDLNRALFGVLLQLKFHL